MGEWRAALLRLWPTTPALWQPPHELHWDSPVQEAVEAEVQRAMANQVAVQHVAFLDHFGVELGLITASW